MKKFIIGTVLFLLVIGVAVVCISARSGSNSFIGSNTAESAEFVQGDTAPVSYGQLYEMSPEEILKSDAALLLFKTFSTKEREQLLGKGTPANIDWEKYFPEYVRINNDTLYTGDYSDIRRTYATYNCGNGMSVVFGESDNTKFCIRIPSSAINSEKISDQFSAAGYEKELIYCTLLSAGNIPEQTAFSSEALNEYLEERDSIIAFLKEAPDRNKVLGLLGTPDAEYGNVRMLLRNPENTIEALDQVLYVKNPTSKVNAIRYMYPVGTEHIKAEVVDVQLFSETDSGGCGTTVLFFDGWLSITFDAEANFLYAFERTAVPNSEITVNTARYIETAIGNDQ